MQSVKGKESTHSTRISQIAPNRTKKKRPADLIDEPLHL